MKNKSFIRENIAALIIILLSVLLVDPLKLWMPSGVQMTLLVFLILAFTFFAVFVWNEKGQDEREQLHIIQAGRLAFLIGSGIIIVGIIYQSYQQAIDPWLVISLVAMVVAKIAGLFSAQINH
jgi:nicotinamide riboside transporter PnuC